MYLCISTKINSCPISFYCRTLSFSLSTTRSHLHLFEILMVALPLLANRNPHISHPKSLTDHMGQLTTTLMCDRFNYKISADRDFHPICHNSINHNNQFTQRISAPYHYDLPILCLHIPPPHTYIISYKY